MNQPFLKLPKDIHPIIVSYLLYSSSIPPTLFLEEDMEDPFCYEHVNDVYNLLQLGLIQRIHCDMIRHERFSFFAQTFWRKRIVSDSHTEFWLEGFPFHKLVLDYTELWRGDSK